MSSRNISRRRRRPKFSESRETREWLRMMETDDRRVEENILAILDSTDDDSLPDYNTIEAVCPYPELLEETMLTIEQLHDEGQWPVIRDHHTKIS